MKASLGKLVLNTVRSAKNVIRKNKLYAYDTYIGEKLEKKK